ncbi:uncharacterized protein [Drosophila pseudoobscura]|uniref:Uncharacterized protein isoform X1 n=1 Tax=Drosophila pseudoobscura pseudoobscura TaxID=46245 RepID=A0A6I8V008_DROPS|nr:uncharacterized protein LOC6901797 isoform X1 [Drosophila pseudoobscura]
MNKVVISEMDDFESVTCRRRSDDLKVYESKTRVILPAPDKRSESVKTLVNIVVENSNNMSPKKQKPRFTWHCTSHGTYQRKLVNDDETLETEPTVGPPQGLASKDQVSLMNSIPSAINLTSQMQEEELLQNATKSEKGTALSPKKSTSKLLKSFKNYVKENLMFQSCANQTFTD